MRTSRALIMALFLAATILPCHVLAQGGPVPPPPPPPGRGEATVPGEGIPELPPVRVHARVDTGAQFNISDDVLDAMGMSRSQFIDQLAMGLFPEDEVDLLIPVLSLMEPFGYDDGGEIRGVGREDGAVERLVAVQVKRFYQIPRFRVRSEEIDEMEQVFLTDGQVFVELNFRPAAWTREQ